MASTRLPPNLYTDAHWAQAIAWLGERKLAVVVPARGEPYFVRSRRREPMPVSAATIKIIHDFCFCSALGQPNKMPAETAGACGN